MTPPSKLLSENSFFTDIFRPCSSFFFNFPAVDQHWMCSFLFSFTRFLTKGKTLPKAQQTWRLSSAYQSSNKFKHKSWSNFIFRISTKHQLQNLNQTSASQLILKFKIFTKLSIRKSTKIQLLNLYKTSAARYWPNPSFKILPDL